MCSRRAGVLNRPFSVQQLLESGGLARIREEYVYIAETDHVLMRPLPNLASRAKAAAFGFGYMHASGSVQRFIDLVAPGTSWRQVQPVGPSPLLIHADDLRRLTPRWLNFSLALKLDKAADARFGWVLEMWGYSIAAASLGISHEVWRGVQAEGEPSSNPGPNPDPNPHPHTTPNPNPQQVLHGFQTEGGAGISAAGAKQRGVYIFHYTYGIEYRMDGRPQGPNQIGEWSLDKRHYGGAYPPRKLQPPPAGASDGATWLCDAWNEASAGIPAWPKTRALGTVGWRRSKGDGIEGSALATAVLGTKWKWAAAEPRTHS